MSLSKRLPIFFFLSITLCFTLSNAVRFDIINNCPRTVWAAAVPGGGMQLNSGGVWIMHNNATTSGRIWARTGYSFDETGTGCCLTGDCGGLLKCQDYGTPPNTLAEYTLYNFDDYTSHNDKDYYDISLVDGFNVPMLFGDDSTGFISINCTGDIYNQCPSALKADGGCNNPCTVFKTDQYCCNSGSCKSTLYSKFFKDRCPDAISYPKDDQTTTLSAISGANYTVVFCP